MGAQTGVKPEAPSSAFRNSWVRHSSLSNLIWSESAINLCSMVPGDLSTLRPSIYPHTTAACFKMVSALTVGFCKNIL